VALADVLPALYDLSLLFDDLTWYAHLSVPTASELYVIAA